MGVGFNWEDEGYSHVPDEDVGHYVRGKLLGPEKLFEPELELDLVRPITPHLKLIWVNPEYE